MPLNCKYLIRIAVFLILASLPLTDAFTFGFAGHRTINRKAVFTLPPEMIGLFKFNIEYITERSIDPDRRSHAVPGEAPRHWIDLELFGDIHFDSIPREWDEAVLKYSEDTLLKYGILPWHVEVMMHRLTRAFADRDIDRILHNAAHIGHYIADLCTPLHTTKYYNGRIPAHRGIHALWESRIVELFAQSYNYMTGRAVYIESPRQKAWDLVYQSHQLVDTIYIVFDSLLTNFPSDQIYNYEMRGQSFSRNFSREFAQAMHDNLNGMVENQMRRAVKAVGDFWYTAWVNSGQPDLNFMANRSISNSHRRALERELREYQNVKTPVGRPNPE